MTNINLPICNSINYFYGVKNWYNTYFLFQNFNLNEYKRIFEHINRNVNITYKKKYRIFRLLV